MRLPFSRAVRMFFDPQAIVPFLLASICLSVIANATYEFLREGVWTGGTLSPIAIGIGAFVMLAGAVVWLAIRLSREVGELDDVGEETPAKRRGLILLVSRPDMCGAAIRFHQPILERVWLICSNETKSSAEALAAEYAPVRCSVLTLVGDMENPQPCFQMVQRIYREELPEGWTSDDVISDCTGMTKPATIGLVMACIGRDRPVQYTRARRDKDGSSIGTLAPVELQFGWARISRETSQRRSTEEPPTDPNRG